MSICNYKALILSSSLRNDDGTALNPANGFVDALRALLPEEIRLLYICSDPDHPELTDSYAHEIFACVERAGFRLVSARVLDPRTDAHAARFVAEADLILLAGGHVPTQNAYFRRIGLRALLANYRGVIVGTSAGSMNCAEEVYAHPEYDEEALSRNYRRFMDGLGLTEIRILPHWNDLQSVIVGGLRAIEDLALPDSHGREFLGIPDGSYVLIRPMSDAADRDSSSNEAPAGIVSEIHSRIHSGIRIEIRGEAHRIADGVILPV